jgi:hypothetical protein
MVLAALLTCGCPALVEVEGDGVASGVPPVVQDRLTQYCAIPGCHSTGAQFPDLSEGGSAATLDQSSGVTGTPFVVFGDVQGSYLALKLLPAPPDGTIMPPPALPPMPPQDVALILGWIAGADLSDAADDGTTGESDGGDGGPGDGSGLDSAGSTGDGMTSGPGDTGGGPAQVCSLQGVDPGAADPVDAGDGAGQIPTVVGEVLNRNCGCHYASEATAPYTALLGLGYQPMETLGDFTAAYAGINPNLYGAGSGADAIYDRVITLGTMPQPILCDLGGGTLITAEDRDLLQTWLDAGTPDGATF